MEEIIIAGTNEVTYLFTFLSMLKLTAASILFYELLSSEENKLQVLQYASSF